MMLQVGLQFASDHNHNGLIEKGELEHIFSVLQIQDQEIIQKACLKPLTIDEFEKCMANHANDILSQNQISTIEDSSKNNSSFVKPDQNFLGKAWGINEQEEIMIRRNCSF